MRTSAKPLSRSFSFRLPVLAFCFAASGAASADNGGNDPTGRSGGNPPTTRIEVREVLQWKFYDWTGDWSEYLDVEDLAQSGAARDWQTSVQSGLADPDTLEPVDWLNSSDRDENLPQLGTSVSAYMPYYGYGVGADYPELQEDHRTAEITAISGAPYAFHLLYRKHELIGDPPNDRNTGPPEDPADREYHVEHFVWDGETLTRNGQPLPVPTGPIRFDDGPFQYGTAELLKVNLESDEAVNSPKTFYSDASSLVTPPSPGSMASGDLNDLLNETLVIDYDQVLNAEGEVEDFYVEMSVPSSIGASVSWTLIETPGGSAQITNASSATARLEFDSESRGGLYRIELTIGGSVTLEGRVWLPVAGPAIDGAFAGEFGWWDLWSEAYNTFVPSRYEAAREHLIDEYPDLPEFLANLVKSQWARNLDMLHFGGSLDWYGDPAGPETPSGYPKQGTAGDGTPDAHRYTLGGHVIDWPTRNNILYAYIGKKMGILEATLLFGPNIHPAVVGVLNTPDTDVQLNAYYAGFALTSESIDSAMDQYGRLMIPTDGWAYREWPSYEITSDGFELTQEGQNRRQDLLTHGTQWISTY